TKNTFDGPLPLAKIQTLLGRDDQAQIEVRLRACVPPQPTRHEKPPVRSPLLPAHPPWRGRAGRAAPSARRAGLPERREQRKEWGRPVAVPCLRCLVSVPVFAVSYPIQ